MQSRKEELMVDCRVGQIPIYAKESTFLQIILNCCCFCCCCCCCCCCRGLSRASAPEDYEPAANRLWNNNPDAILHRQQREQFNGSPYLCIVISSSSSSSVHTHPSTSQWPRATSSTKSVPLPLVPPSATRPVRPLQPPPSVTVMTPSPAFIGGGGRRTRE